MLKRTLLANGDQFEALLELRNTPRQDTGKSPTQLVFGHKTLSFVPAMNYRASEKTDEGELKRRRKVRQEKVKISFDRTARNLTGLQRNQPVWYQHHGKGSTWSPAKVTNASESNRSYVIQTEDGTILRRNRVHLRPRAAVEPQVTLTDTQEEPRTTADEERRTVTAPVTPVRDDEPSGLRRSTRVPNRPPWMADYVV